MRIKVFFALITLYILLAFGWLTFSLINFSNNQFVLQENILNAGINTCILQVIREAKNGNLGQDTATDYFIGDLELDLDTNELLQFVNLKYKNNFIVELKSIDDRKVTVNFKINPTKVIELEQKKRSERKIWVVESLLLFVLVFSGIYGVYYSLKSIYQLNKQQNNFLLSVTHELKTPIAAIRLMLQTLQRPNLDPLKAQDLTQRAVQNTNRLEELTENMLTAMQMESKKYNFNEQEFDLSALVLKVIHNYQIKGEINHNISPNIMLKGDPFVFRIALSNLVENAFKYSDYQPIEINLEKNKRIFLQIKDRGIGVKQSERKKIFRRFYRTQDEETRTTKGTGLGLYIVKQVIDRHNGEILVTDNLPNGTIFSISI